MENKHINESILSEEILEDQKKNRIDHMTYLPDMQNIGSDIMDQVIDAMNSYDYQQFTAADVKRALAHTERTPQDFQALLSPAALPFLEEIAQAARKETKAHFGNSVYMFTPIYIANYCENYCIYCGFNCHNKIHRARLTPEEIDKEMAAIAATGLQEILILTGESPTMSTVEFEEFVDSYVSSYNIADRDTFYKEYGGEDYIRLSYAENQALSKIMESVKTKVADNTDASDDADSSADAE